MAKRKLICDTLEEMREIVADMVESKLGRENSKLLAKMTKLIEEAQGSANRMEGRLIQYNEFCTTHARDLTDLIKKRGGWKLEV